MICRAPFLIMSHEFHIHAGCTVSICDEVMPYEPFIIFYTKMGGGACWRAAETRVLLIYSRAIEEVTFNKTSMKHDCHVIWHFPPKKALFFQTKKCYCLSMLSIIHVCPHLMFSTLYFKSSLSTILIKKDNVMHFLDFCTRDFEVAILKLIIRTPLCIVMLPG